MENDIEKEVQKIIEQTTQFDFPFMAGIDRKNQIIKDKKAYIEAQFKKISPDNYPDEDMLINLWNESVKYSDEQFESLSDRHKINGFYLQELMHCYAEKIGKLICYK